MDPFDNLTSYILSQLRLCLSEYELLKICVGIQHSSIFITLGSLGRGNLMTLGGTQTFSSGTITSFGAQQHWLEKHGQELILTIAVLSGKLVVLARR